MVREFRNNELSFGQVRVIHGTEGVGSNPWLRGLPFLRPWPGPCVFVDYSSDK
jgi:hypothetical protein